MLPKVKHLKVADQDTNLYVKVCITDIVVPNLI